MTAQEKSGTSLRRRSREMALQLLFQREFGAGRTSDARVNIREFVSHFQIQPEVADYGAQLFNAVTERTEEIDRVIQAHSAHWKTSRMGLVDLSVMRIAVVEMKFINPPVPPNVVINEAVEIAKTFGSTESGSFVNGILDHVARTL